MTPPNDRVQSERAAAHRSDVEAVRVSSDRASDDTRSAGHPDQKEDWTFFREALPEYDVRERVHYGGQGIVYRAIQRATKRQVAIKVLLHGPLATDRQRQRFAREMELVGRLRHPDIVKLYEAGEVRGRPFLVMEYVDGQPIDDYVLVNDLPVRRIVQVFGRVCRAIGSAHERGVIHRDIKPANILVDAAGKPYVLDFGLARDISGADDADDKRPISLTGQVVGTLPYLSPEQAGGLNEAIDVRSDIYSLGVVLFELITGSSPYPTDGSADAVRANIISRDPLPLRKALGRNTCDRPDALRDINDDLDKVILKALEKDKARRYHSAASLADDLDCYLAGEAVQAKAHSHVYLLRKTLRRFRVHVATAAAFVALLIGAVVVTTVQWKRSAELARLYQTGMHMGLLGRLGSVERDAGRIDRAEQMLAQAAEMAKLVPATDVVVGRYVYDAHHKLAELYYATGKPERADPISETAFEIAERLHSDEPTDPERRRLLGFSEFLRGRKASGRKDWARALRAFDKAVSIRRELLSLEPRNSSLSKELALALEWLGSSNLRLDRFDDSLRHLTEAHDIYEHLAAQQPEVVDYSIGLSRTEIRLAICFEAQDAPEHYRTALDWLEVARDRLLQLRESGHSLGREWQIEKLLKNIRTHEEWTLEQSQ